MALTGLALDILNACGHAQNGGNGGNMLYQLVGQCAGKPVAIIGNGPSARRFGGNPESVDLLPNDAECEVICLNNALGQFPWADIWLISESQVHRAAPWFYDHTEYAGLTIWDSSMVLNGLLEDNAARKESGQPHYSDEFLCNVIWFLRQGIDGAATGPPDAFRSFQDGLYGYLAMPELDSDWLEGEYEHGELVGSAAFQAIHLAAGMGATTAHLYGVELSWNRDESQHADGLDTFHPDGEPVNRPIEIGGMMSTAYFKDSAHAIRWFAKNADIALINHSGGLLDMIE